ncbi:hypothetical protein JG687_00007666 [Phytophthora cactorum]|uniref:Uncharacterized protein n=1 Tax=Phytophthora cactorum TaxID=29920 RepID=A0A8T1UHL2_9STRA|nr:hypothetical protein JG687_00007666 [Phytophthora cactorum]
MRWLRIPDFTNTASPRGGCQRRQSSLLMLLPGPVGESQCIPEATFEHNLANSSLFFVNRSFKHDADCGRRRQELQL